MMKPKFSKRTLWISASVLGVIVLAAASLWAWNYALNPAPDPKTAEPEQIAEFMASDRFARMSDEEKAKYTQQAMPQDRQRRRAMFRSGSKLSEEKRRKLHRNMRSVFRQHMQKRMEEYFELPPEKQQARLDQIIDGMQAMRKRMEQHRRERKPRDGNDDNDNNEDRRRHRRGRGFSPERMKRHIENTPPEIRAQFMEFHKALRKRMKERGIDPPHRR